MLKATVIAAPGYRVVERRTPRSRPKIIPGHSWVLYERSDCREPICPVFYAETFDECLAEIKRAANL